MHEPVCVGCQQAILSNEARYYLQKGWWHWHCLMNKKTNEVATEPAINIILAEEGPDARFVEIETDDGKGMGIGTRLDYNGLTRLRITAAEIMAACEPAMEPITVTRNMVGTCSPIKQEAIYPCLSCGKLRTKDEGGTTFTLCDSCWDEPFHKVQPEPKLALGATIPLAAAIENQRVAEDARDARAKDPDEIKVGDEVECVDTQGAKFQLDLGKHYKVKTISDIYVRLEEDPTFSEWYKSCFRKVQPKCEHFCHTKEYAFWKGKMWRFYPIRVLPLAEKEEK